MVPIRSELFFPARVLWFGVKAANIGADDPRTFAQFPERPLQIGNFEPAVLPVCGCIFSAQTIEINRNVNVFVAKTRCELFELLAPILAQDCARTLSIFRRAIVR